MNRELKLALIIGFSLVLLVTVLISDHLSAARRASLAGVEPTKPLAAVDPTSQAFLATPERAPDAPAAELAGPALTVPAEPLASPTPTPAPEAPAELAGAAPVEFDQGTGRLAGDSGLVEAIRQLGGSVVDGADGVREIRMNAPPGLIAGSAPSAGTTGETAGRVPDGDMGRGEVRHVVAAGEAVYDIAKKYYGAGSKWTLIREANPDRISPKGVVRAGVTLKIPLASADAPATPAARPDVVREPQPEARPAPQPRTRGAGPVEVAQAPRREAQPRQSAQATPRTENRPQAGTQAGRQQSESRQAQATPPKGTYVVRSGDTLGEIAERVLGSSRRKSELMRLNGINDEDSIRVGAVLKLPQ